MGSAVWNYLRLAGGVAPLKRRDVRNYRFGAVAVRRDGVVVFARNGSADFPLQVMHAESRVVRKAGRGAVIFVCRIGRDGGFRLARPCDGCLSELRNRRARRVYYTINDVEYGCIRL